MLERKIQLEFPEFVYFNLPAKFASLIVTAPNRQVEIPENAEAEPNPTELSIKMKNNGAYGVHLLLKNSDLLERIRFLSPEVYQSLAIVDHNKLNQVPRVGFVELLRRMSDSSVTGLLEREVQEALKKEGKATPHNYDARMDINGAFYKGIFFPFEEFATLRPSIEKDLEVFGSLTHVKKGDYLYRAANQNEWQQIARDGSYLIRVETNFEDKVGQQVQDYARDPSYSGRIIRIKVEGPFFRNAGIQVPRVTSVLPHFANHVEVLDGGNWINLRDYKAK